MIIFDPESNTAIEPNTNRIIHNAIDKIKCDKVLTCEWDDPNPHHNKLLLLAELHFNRKYPRFINFAQSILGSEPIYLLNWEKVKDGNDLDKKQNYGRKRVEIMNLVVSKFLERLSNPKNLLMLGAALSRIMSSPATDPTHTLDLSGAKVSFFDIYSKSFKSTDYVHINTLVTQVFKDRGYVQNWWGRRIYNKGQQVETYIKSITNNKSDNILGWMIHSSVHDTAIFIADYLSQILKPKNESAGVSKYQCVNVSVDLLLIDKTHLENIIDLAKNPDCLFDKELIVECTKV